MPPAELYTRLALIGLYNPPALVISKHNDASFYQGIASRNLGKWIASCACHIIAISNAVRIHMIKEFNLPGEQISTIHYGIDPVPYSEVPAKEVAALRSSWLSGNSGWVIGTVARLVPEKAVHTLIEGYATYREQATKASRLVIVGRGPLEQELKKFAEHLGIGDKVIWAGFREDIPAVMAAFDLFALTSIREGFGMVLLEAMAAKRPIVASAVSAIPEVVVDGRTGVLFPALDTDRLANALLLFETDAIRKGFEQAGYELVSSHFTLDKMVERTLEIYREHVTNER
jgi:glycosyltransferase involved in cell wall biosynthesis